MTNYYNIISFILLVCSIFLIINKRPLAYIRTFRVQSLIIVIGALFMATQQHHIELIIISVIMFGLKVIYIPRYLHSTYEHTTHNISKDFYFNIPTLSFIACLLVAFSYFSVSNISLIDQKDIVTTLTCNISIVLIGLLFMISRKDAIGEIIGFLVIENGLFSTALFSTHGMPFIIDLGIFIDLLTGVLIMSTMVFQIDTKFQTTDTDKLNNLRG